MKNIIKHTFLTLTLGIASIVGINTTAQADGLDFTANPPYIPYGYSNDHYLAGANWYCDSDHNYCFEYGEMRLPGDPSKYDADKVISFLKHNFEYDQNYNCYGGSNYFTCSKSSPDGSYGWAAKVKYVSYRGLIQVVKVHYDKSNSNASSYGAENLAGSIF